MNFIRYHNSAIIYNIDFSDNSFKEGSLASLELQASPYEGMFITHARMFIAENCYA